VISEKNLANSFILFLLNLLIFFNYQIFIFSTIIFFSYFIYKESKFSNNEKILLKILPINYYINNFMSLESNSGIFWDMQNFIHYLKCNISEVSHTYLFTQVKKKCPDTIGYGPLTEYLKIYDLDIWTTAVVFFILFVIITSVFLIKSNDLLLLTVVILISPGFHFLIFSLNTDIFVITYLVYLLSKENFGKNIKNLIIISLITQVKIYTVFLFFGYFLIYFLKKDKKSLSIISLFTISNLFFLTRHYLIDDFDIPAPISFTRTFGVYHDLQIVRDYIGYDELSVLIFFTFVLLLVGKNKIQQLSNNFLNNISKETSLKILLIFPVIMVINLYQNWGYKFLFNSIFIYIIFNYCTKPFKVYLIITTLFSTMYYMIGWGFQATIVNYILISLSKLTFYSFVVFTIYIFIQSIMKLTEGQN
jgi:hypothetical protein